jgi:hypothetical protein
MNNVINQIYDAFVDIQDHERDLLRDMVQGTSPCCGSDVSLGHCHSCGEPTDPIEDMPEEEADQE